MSEKIIVVKHVGEPVDFHCPHLRTVTGEHATMTEAVYDEIAADFPNLYEIEEDEEIVELLEEHYALHGCGPVNVDAWRGFKENQEAKEIEIEEAEDEEAEDEEAEDEEAEDVEAEEAEDEEAEEAEDEEAEDEEAPAPPTTPRRGRARGRG